MSIVKILSEYIARQTESKRKHTPFWKFEFDSNSYWSDFKFSNVKKHVIIAVILLLFGDYIAENAFPRAISFIGSNVNSGIIGNLVFYYVVSIYLICSFINRISKGYLPTFNSLIAFGIYSILYIFLIRRSESFIFLPLDYTFKYLDIFFIGVTISSIKWSLYFTRLDTDKLNYQFITDRKNQLDLFGYKGLSKELNEFIHHTETEHSFAIGILGNWGDGKTYLSNDLQSDLERFSDDYIIVDFNPWLYNKEQLVDGFFNEFLTATSTIDRSLKNDIVSYIDKITEKYSGEYIQLANLTSKLLTNFRSSEDIKKSISQKIKLSRKKIIIFLDDTDRLDNEEIKEVLKIIRNCADFSNTFFIAGIDYNYINSKVDNPKYLEKIFNVLIGLPKISPSILKNEIKTKFELNFPDDNEITKAILDLLQYEWFSHFIKNLRQLNRIINSFKIAYNRLKKNIDVTDLIILETLKNSETKVYFAIYNDEIIKYDPLNVIATGDEKESYSVDLKKELNTNEEEPFFTKQALNYLLKREGTKHMRAFSKGYELLYFNYANRGIDIISFYDVIDKDETILINKFNEWISDSDDTRYELLQLLTLHLSKDPITNFSRYLPILTKIEDRDFANRVFVDVYLKELQNDRNAKAQESLKKYQDDLLATIENTTSVNVLVSFDWTSSVFLNILRRKKDSESNSELPEEVKKRAEKMYRTLLPKIVESNIPFFDKYEAFKKCVLAIKNNIFQYDPECTSIFKNYVMKADTEMIELLKASIIPFWNNTYDENNRELIIVDFLSLIFNNKDELLERIFKIESDEISPLISFLEIHINDYYQFRNSGSTFGKYVKEEELHKKLLKYFGNKNTQNYRV